MVVLVTGANGQLGQALQFIATKHPALRFHFLGSKDLDITAKDQVTEAFANTQPDYCINAAAYTAVDKAESEPESARAINVDGVLNLAQAAQTSGTIMIHVSTDFVFDGSKSSPYLETDTTQPQGVYALTKRDGELALQQTCDRYFIIRTSWVYSNFGSNFMKTMLRVASERDAINVVNDQIGSPTHAIDLAEAIVAVIESGSKNYGIYHFSNEGVASWYDFAKEIFSLNGVAIQLNPIPTSAYPTPAKRPPYSVLDKSKFKTEFKFAIPDWQDSLKAYK
ncbi:MAG TPA: dTDP-4-dehydrorhamnose reductase [Flavobacterium sp.]|jgi:dTDP-4-dehydrorhamnose reductase|nr:dTDP-4-dehydrorhamnose reductase [Flavobacterium sp.]HPJ10880.1 dTDP-4-dehydrorhamnose reductase [Flavobacterium sp.]